MMRQINLLVGGDYYCIFPAWLKSVTAITLDRVWSKSDSDLLLNCVSSYTLDLINTSSVRKYLLILSESVSTREITVLHIYIHGTTMGSWMLWAIYSRQFTIQREQSLAESEIVKLDL